MSRNYVDHDPVVSHMKQLQAPFQWREAAEGIRVDKSSGEVMGDAGAFKLRDGLAFPLITLDGQIVMVSLGGEAVQLSADEFGLVSLVSTYAVGRAMQLHTMAAKTIDHIELTPREYALLDVMMQHAGEPVSRATLLEEVWSTSGEASTNIVDVYMKYLRDKIDLPGEPKLTHTVRGFGYELRVS